jgi:hypothetical protein
MEDKAKAEGKKRNARKQQQMRPLQPAGWCENQPGTQQRAPRSHGSLIPRTKQKWWRGERYEENGCCDPAGKAAPMLRAMTASFSGLASLG